MKLAREIIFLNYNNTKYFSSSSKMADDSPGGNGFPKKKRKTVGNAEVVKLSHFGMPHFSLVTILEKK